MQAKRVAERSGALPGTITIYSDVALCALASADLAQARAFVDRNWAARPRGGRVGRQPA
jgi:hypothetical protein